MPDFILSDLNNLTNLFPGGSDGKESACNAGDLGLMLALGWEDLLEEGMATYSSILAWRIPWIEDPGSPWGCKELDTTEQFSFTYLIS